MIINELLEKEKMSRYRLSKESGVAMTTITDICSGKADINKCAAGTLHKNCQSIRSDSRLNIRK